MTLTKTDCAELVRRLISTPERFEVSLFSILRIARGRVGRDYAVTLEPIEGPVQRKSYSRVGSAIRAFLAQRDRRQLGYDHEIPPGLVYEGGTASTDDLVCALIAAPGFYVTFRGRLVVWPLQNGKFAVTKSDKRGQATGWEEIFDTPEAAAIRFLRACLALAQGDGAEPRASRRKMIP